ncbi:Amino acid transporter transmembrane domain-containing protein [Plasmodiophora brassicae]
MPSPAATSMQNPLLDPPSDDDEGRPRFPSPSTRVERDAQSPSWRMVLLSPDKDLPRISCKASALSLIATMVGGGALSIPYAVQESGLISSAVILLAIAVSSGFSLELLLQCSRLCDKANPSYTEVALEALGRPGRAVSSLLILAMTFLAVVAYLMLLGDIVPTMAAYAYASEPGGTEWFTRKGPVLSLVCAFAYPVCCVRHLRSLRYANLVGFASMLFLSVCMLVRLLDHTAVADAASLTPIVWFRTDMRLLLGVSVMSVSFVCHFNLLPVHFSLKRPTRRRATRLVNMSITVATLVYLLIGTTGYLTFRGRVLDNILMNYGRDDALLNCGRATLAVTIFCGIPVVLLPNRDLIEETLFGTLPYSRLRSAAQTFALLGAALLVAVHVPRIVYVWDFVGSTASSIAMFILPPVFYLRLRRRPLTHDAETRAAFALLVGGAVVAVACTVDSVLNVVNGPPTQ